MRKYTVFFLFIFFSFFSFFICVHGESLKTDWTAENSYGGDDWGYGIKLDSSNNIYIVGTKNDVGDNILIRKYNSSGVEDWTTNYDSGGMDYAGDIALDSSGNIYIIGTTNTAYGKRIVVLKYNNSGGKIWEKYYQNGDHDSNHGYDIAVSTSGNIYATGSEYKSGSSNGKDIWLRKYDTNGFTIWTSTYNSPNNGEDESFGVDIDNSGNAYISGYNTRNDLSQGKNVFIRKYDTNGFTIWTSTYNSPNNGEDEAYGIKIDDENIILPVMKIEMI